MNKRIFLLVLIILFVLQGWALAAPVTIIDPDGQRQVGVTGSKLNTADYPKGIQRATGSAQLYSGSCRVKLINFFSDTAGDRVAVYNYGGTGVMDATELEFEIGISANNSSQSVDAGGTTFSNGIYVTSNSATAITTVTYDY